MTITSSSPRTQQITAAGITEINIPFDFEKNQDLLVYKTLSGATPDPEADILTLNNDYTVTGAGYGNPTAARYITLKTPSLLDDTYTIVREMAIERSTDFNVSGEFSSADLNNQFDDLVAMVQQVNMKIEKLGLLYEDNQILSALGEQNVLPKLPSNTGSGIPIWTTNTVGDLVAGSAVEGSGYSTLRSELINNTSGTEGAKIVGYFNASATPNNTYVQDALDELYARPNNNGFQTGDMKMSFGSLHDPAEWLEYNDGYLKLTTFSPSDGRPVNFGSQYEDLYTELWTTCADAQAPVIGGRGASAADDWADDKPLRMPLMVGRVLGVNGTALSLQDFTIVGAPTTLITVTDTSIYEAGMRVRFTTTGTLPTGLLLSTDYWIGINSGTELIIYDSEINYTEGTAVSITTAGTGTHTVEVQHDATVIGEHKGYENHIMTQTELPQHRHGMQTNGDGTAGSSNRHSITTGTTPSFLSNNTGSSNAFNIMQPSSYVKLLIKL